MAKVILTRNHIPSTYAFALLNGSLIDHVTDFLIALDVGEGYVPFRPSHLRRIAESDLDGERNDLPTGNC